MDLQCIISILEKIFRYFHRKETHLSVQCGNGGRRCNCVGSANGNCGGQEANYNPASTNIHVSAAPYPFAGAGHLKWVLGTRAGDTCLKLNNGQDDFRDIFTKCKPYGPRDFPFTRTPQQTQSSFSVAHQSRLFSYFHHN